MLTTQLNSIQESVARSVIARMKELNMAERLPTVKSLPNILNKALGMVEDAATKLAQDIEGMGNRGHEVIGKVGNVVQEAKNTFNEIEKSLEANSNGGPLAKP